MFPVRPPVPFQRVANGHIWFFTARDWSQVLPWQQHKRCHSVSRDILVMILFSVLLQERFMTSSIPHLHNTKM